MGRYRTINAAIKEIKATDPDTAITGYFLRTLCSSGEIPTRFAGSKYIVDLDDIEAYFEKNSNNDNEQKRRK